MRVDFTKLKDFISLPTPINFGNYEAIGHFPYEKAQLSSKCVCIPNSIYAHIFTALPDQVRDNKIVVVFRVINRFNTENFAIQFKDGYCKVGEWADVQGYSLRDLK